MKTVPDSTVVEISSSLRCIVDDKFMICDKCQYASKSNLCHACIAADARKALKALKLERSELRQQVKDLKSALKEVSK